jgi:hypothetical protein
MPARHERQVLARVLSEVGLECGSAPPHLADARQDSTELTLWVGKRKSRFPSRTRFAVALGEVPINAARQRSFVVAVTSRSSRQQS